MPEPKNIPRKGPLNCRSLGCARDDKGKSASDLISTRPNESMGAPGLAFETWDPCNRAVVETRPSPLSSRAQPRDLQFSGPFLGMFFGSRLFSSDYFFTGSPLSSLSSIGPKFSFSSSGSILAWSPTATTIRFSGCTCSCAAFSTSAAVTASNCAGKVW
jgi:hypothetical protein